MQTPPRIFRRRYGTPRRMIVRRNTYLRRGLGSALSAARILRSVGAPPMKHIISRPGSLIKVSDNGTNIQINGAVISTANLGNGCFVASRANGEVFNTIKFGMSQLFQFSLLQVPADLVGLYDNYRIKGVKLRFDLSFNNAPTSGGTSNMHMSSMPLLHYCVDPDDITCPTSENSVLQYSKSKTVRLGDGPIFITLQPRAQGTAAATVTTSATSGAGNEGQPTTAAVSNMLSTNTWFDCQNGQTVPFFGMKYWFEHMPMGNVTNGQLNWVLTISPTYILEMKNIH